MIIAIILLGAGAVIASGVLFRHLRMLTFIAAAGVLWEAAWMAITWIDRTWLAASNRETVYLIGSIVWLTIWLTQYRRWRLPYQIQTGSGRRDFAVLIALVPVLISACLVINANGWQGKEWVTHGFFNGDTMTLVALTQRSFITDGLVTENLFAGNGYLEYPTLIHASLATFFEKTGIGEGWLAFWPTLLITQILLTVPLFFLLADIVFAEPKEKWVRWLGIKSRFALLSWQVLTVWYVMAMAWDSFIFPQSHYFITGIFLLAAALLLRSEDLNEKSEWLVTATGMMAAVILVGSNAVTGTAAAAMVAFFHLSRAMTRSRAVWNRILHLGLIFIWPAAIIAFNPGEAAFGLAGFSYVSAGGIMKLAPLWVMLTAGIVIYIERMAFYPGAVTIIASLGIIVFIFSTRNIVAENAERFIYHAAMFGWPLLIAPTIRLIYKAKEILKYHSLKGTQLIAGWTAAAIGLGLVILPATASLAQAHDSLLRQDRKVVSEDAMLLASWISGGKKSDEIYLTNPEGPWFIPMMTGRTILRARYWLSPQDEIYELTKAAYQGDRAAQQAVLQHADLVVIRQDEKDKWDLSQYARVFSSDEHEVYDLGKSPRGN